MNKHPNSHWSWAFLGTFKIVTHLEVTPQNVKQPKSGRNSGHVRNSGIYGTFHHDGKISPEAARQGDLKCREVKTGFAQRDECKPLISNFLLTLIGWKSGKTTYVPLWDRMEGGWLWTLELGKNHLCPSMWPNGGSVAMDSGTLEKPRMSLYGTEWREHGYMDSDNLEKPLMSLNETEWRSVAMGLGRVRR